MTLTVAPLTWPFWAPTPLEEIERALDVAGVGPGCRLLDLGCGDGRVLEAAVRRDAVATGYEIDPVWAERARQRIEHLEGAQIVETDFHTAPLDADVVFAFLSPAVLYRLRPRLAVLSPGTRVVTYGYGVVGWRPSLFEGPCFRYDLPPAPSADAFSPGWRQAGLAIAHPGGQTVLVAALFGATPGALDLQVSESLRDRLEVHLGASEASQPSNVPIDLKFTSSRQDEVLSGSLSLQGRELYLYLISGGPERLTQRLQAPELAAFEALRGDVEAGRRPLSQLIASLPRGAVPSSH